MILIFLSWILLFYCFIGFGVFGVFLFKIDTKSITKIILTGMVLQTILLTISAFFIPLNYQLFISNLIISSILTLYFRSNLMLILKITFNNFKNFDPYLKIIFFIILTATLFKCAQVPFILDNESYYIQTIKWLNEYGFVKGLANLNIAFGQTSGWHILQSGFNFSFLTDRLNDINGFLMVICSYYFLSKIDNNLKEFKAFHWIGFVLFFNVLSFQFINTPSPDFPVLILSQIIFYLFLKKSKLSNDIKMISLLFIFLVFIKITIAPIGLLLIYNFYKEKKGILFFTILSFVFGVLWVSKNLILTGYPIFPFGNFSLNFDWTIPKKLLENINNMIKNHEFLHIENYKNLSVLKKFSIWIQLGGINGIFNKGMILLFLIAPFTRVIKTLIAYRVLYFVLLFHFIFVFLIAPQFRFFLAEFIFLSVIVTSDLVFRWKINNKVLKISLIIAVIAPLFIIYFINLKSLTENKFNQDYEKMNWSQIYLPEKNSKFGSMTFDKIKLENLDYYSPKIDYFIYATCDGPLPCVNKNELNYFKKELKIIPQLRTNQLKDGFFSKEIQNNKSN